MRRYTADFTGRRVHATGLRYDVTGEECQGDNEESARIELYNRWEHITGLQLTERFSCLHCGQSVSTPYDAKSCEQCAEDAPDS